MTPVTTEQEAPQTDHSSAVKWHVTTRSIVIGTALIPLNVYWVIVSEYRIYNILTLNPLFVTPVFYLFALVGVNRLLRRVAPRWTFNPAELLVIYIMLVMSCTIATHDYIVNLITTMSWSHWLATPENGWERTMLPLLPKGLVVTDRSALTGYFQGNVSMYDPRILRAWGVPMMFWSGFVMVCGWVMLCLSVVFRKAWVEQLGLKEGDDVNVVAARDGTIEVETREDQRRRALDRMAARNWTLPEGYRFDRDEANER